MMGVIVSVNVGLPREVAWCDRTSVPVVDECRELRPFLPQLVGHVAQRLAGLCAIQLDARLAQRGCHHALPGLRHIGQRIPHQVNATALPVSRRVAAPARRFSAVHIERWLGRPAQVGKFGLEPLHGCA